MFTVIDWSVTAFEITKSHNFLRTFFGFLLGIAYIFSLILVITCFPNLAVIGIGIFYVLLATVLIYIKNTKRFCYSKNKD